MKKRIYINIMQFQEHYSNSEGYSFYDALYMINVDGKYVKTEEFKMLEHYDMLIEMLTKAIATACSVNSGLAERLAQENFEKFDEKFNIENNSVIAFDFNFRGKATKININ